MFDLIPTDSVLFWIWFSGFVAISPIVYVVWILNSAFLGDSMDAWYRRKMFAWFTFLGFVMTWLWPIGVTGFLLHSENLKRKRRNWNKVWNHKKETVPNYWKNYYLILNGNVTDIQVKVLDWDYSQGHARLVIWTGDSRFWCEGKEIIVFWPNTDLEPIPEGNEKV
jgi:hypothetical protein